MFDERGIVLCLFNLKLLYTWFTYLELTLFFILCCVFCVLYCSVTSYCSVLMFFFGALYSSLFLYCNVSACDVRAATLTEGFPCFSLVVRQMPRYNFHLRGTARTSQIG
jgi:hypothetical protein